MTQTLKVFYAAVLLAMVFMTAWASLKGGNVLPAAAVLWGEPWGRATLVDAYFAFATIFLWVCSVEKKTSTRVLWFALIMTLGNLAVASFMLRRLSRLKPGGDLRAFLTEAL